MVEFSYTSEALWQRIERAVEKVTDRMKRVAAALDAAGIEYTVVGGNAVQMWVAQVDEAAVRNTRDVDAILNRDDLPQAIAVLESVGFQHAEGMGVAMFLDGPDASPRDAVHVVFAGEKVQPDYSELVPKLSELQRINDVQTVDLESLVRMKLTSHRLKDRVHLLDMLSVGLIDASWLSRFSPALQDRLQTLIDNPDSQRHSIHFPPSTIFKRTNSWN